MPVQRFVRYGTTADAKYLGQIRNDVSVLVVGANMAAHAGQAIFSFLQTTMRGRQYLIDPLTHAFQHDIGLLTSVSKKTGKVGLRRSWSQLRKEYGLPGTIETGLQSVLVGDVNISRLALKVVEFQRGFCDRQSGSSEDSGLYDWVARKRGNSAGPSPYGIIAPYFKPVYGQEDEWIALNLKLLVATRELLEPDERLLAEVLIGDVTDQDSINKVHDALRQTRVDGILLWLDGFDEHDASECHLQQYISLLKKLQPVAEIVSLHGGYFSILCGLALGSPIGVCHGMEYGEVRSVVPVGGGMPFARFYHPRLHRRLKVMDCLPLVKPHLATEEDYLMEVCSCDTCRRLLAEFGPEEGFAKFGESRQIQFYRAGQLVSKDIPTPQATALCLQHYLAVKNNEYREARTLTDLLCELEQCVEAFDHKGMSAYTRHLTRWCRVLRGVV